MILCICFVEVEGLPKHLDKQITLEPHKVRTVSSLEELGALILCVQERTLSHSEQAKYAEMREGASNYV
jgi:hypothetical protein